MRGKVKKDIKKRKKDSYLPERSSVASAQIKLKL